LQDDARPVSLRCPLSFAPPPTTAEFLAGLEAAVRPQGPPKDIALFGDTFSKETSKRGGSEKTAQGSLAPLQDFQTVLDAEKVSIEDLDEWFAAFAKWCINVVYLFDEAKDQQDALAQRETLCANAGVTIRCWTPGTLRTILNGAAAKYKAGKGSGTVVPGEPTLFPNFCTFWNAAYRRERGENSRRQQIPVLADDEVELLYDKTNWQSFLDAQRMNLLIMAYQLGSRPESLISLAVGNFHPTETAEGTEVLVKFACMKNLQPKQSNVGKPAHEQLLLPNPNLKLCAVAAWRRQLNMLPAGDSSARDAPFWLSVRVNTTPGEGAKGATYSSFKGAAEWASKVLARKITFKDYSRRPFVTKLANAMGAHDAAKAVGILPRTVDRYHRSGNDLQPRAALAGNQVTNYSRPISYFSPFH
jgi:hypothetical protein